MHRLDLDKCGYVYTHSETLQHRYAYSGHPVGIAKNTTSQITLAGCKALCGSGSDYYAWSLASSTITTWILPIVGILLQAPFESNSVSRTVLAIARWVGSPMASIAYILWNVKVSGKCALMVDMATRCDDLVPARDSDFGSIRDSFYILINMNQFTMRRDEALNKEAEGLLRMVLFSKDLRLRGRDGKEKKLNEVRQELAQKLRATRKRGVVPVYISTMWFLFSLAVSIQSSFGQIGRNATAHDLALGLLLAWLPVLILCSIVDRNPIAADDIRKKLNRLIETVCESLKDDEIREEFISTFDGRPEARRLEEWVVRISLRSDCMHDFFVAFAGQGRVRWHYGAAHPILSDIENSYVAMHGRGWLDNEAEARTHLVLGRVDGGLLWFDLRELWQIASAVIIVGGTCSGAFVLSFYTPTVGLGCRSGGYVIFCTMALSLLVLELLVWWISSPVRPEQPPCVRKMIARMDEASRGLRRRAEAILTIFGLRCRLRSCRSWGVQQWTHACFFRPLEMINAAWLIYIVLAQTFGSYRTCDCSTSTWGGAGGYMDFNQNDITNSPWVKWYWSAGTTIGTCIMSFGMIYVVLEWCVQSHLSTENYAAAARGLRRTRRYRLLTYPIRFVARTLTRAVLALRDSAFGLLGIQFKPQQSLLWTPRPPKQSDERQGYRAFGSVCSYLSNGDAHGHEEDETGAGPPGATPMIQLDEWDDAHHHHHHDGALTLENDIGGPSTPSRDISRNRSRDPSDTSSLSPLINLNYPDSVLTHDWASVNTSAAGSPARRPSYESPPSPTTTPTTDGAATGFAARRDADLLRPVAAPDPRPGYARQGTDDGRGADREGAAVAAAAAERSGAVAEASSSMKGGCGLNELKG